MFGFPKSTDAAGGPNPFRLLPRLSELEERTVPTVVAVNDNYQATQGQVLSVGPNQGVLANDFTTRNSGDILQASLVGRPVFFDKGNGAPQAGGSVNGGNQLATPVPNNALTLNPNGSFTLAVPGGLAANVSDIDFTYEVTNVTDPTDPPATGFVQVFLTQSGGTRFAVGAAAGGGPQVNVYDSATGRLVQSIDAYEPTFTGGVRVALANLGNTGFQDIITAPGPGGGPLVKVFDGQTGRLLFSQFVYESTFTGGLYVASGDVNGDSFPDIIIGAGEGGGPRVQIINGQSFLSFQNTTSAFNANQLFDPTTGQISSYNILADFFAYEDSFRGGVRVAAGDIDGVGRAYIVTAPAAGGGPVVKEFDYNQVVGAPTTQVTGTGGNALGNNGVTTPQPFNNPGLNFGGSAAPLRVFSAGDTNSRTGINLAVGDLRGDGKADIVIGTGAGAAIVEQFDGRTTGLIRQFGVPTQTQTAGSISPAGPGTFGTAQQTGVNQSGTLLNGTQAPSTLLPAAGTTGALFPGVANGGVTVAIRQVFGSTLGDIITGAGPGNQPIVRIFDTQSGTEASEFLAFTSTFTGGVNVG